MTEAQRVTFVSHTSKPGGGELALRRYLEATTLPVRLVTMEGQGVWAGLTADVVEVRGVRGLARALRGERLVVANSMRSAFLTALVLPRRARLVYWVRDGLTDSAMSRLGLILTKVVTARRVSHYLANSGWTAKTVEQVLRVEHDKITVVPSMCGIGAATLRPPEGRPRTPLRLLYLGRIAPWKAPDVAVRAVAELRAEGIDATLTMAGGAHFGEKAYARGLQQLAEAEAGVSVLGHIDDVASLLRDHDVLVHCSTTPEPFGQVIVQGLASGMPVVATNHGGPVEILQEAPTNLLYQPGDPSALARAVEAAVDNYEVLRTWGQMRSASFRDDILRDQLDRTLIALTV